MNWASYWLGVATPFVIPLGAADIYFLIRLSVYLHQYYFTDHCSSSQCIICNAPYMSNFKMTIHRRFNRRHRKLYRQWKADQHDLGDQPSDNTENHERKQA